MDALKLKFSEIIALSPEQQKQAVKVCQQELLALRMDIFRDSSKQVAKKQTLRRQVARLLTARHAQAAAKRGEK
jgi:ribosomal protein L29